MNVIGLKGYAQVGKSTAGQYLVNRGYERTSFAEGIKVMLGALLKYQGVPDHIVDRMLRGDLKEVGTQFLSGKSPRVAMQTLGTEWGRALHDDFWINIWSAKVGDKKVCVDDMRFPNEAKAVRDMGGFVIEIVKDAKDAGKIPVGIEGHASEAMNFDPDIIVENDGRSLTRLASNMNDALHVLSQEATE